jgi:hypothetical protein
MLKTYLNSFKNKKLLFVLLLNLAFVALTAVIIQLLLLTAHPWIENFKAINPETLIYKGESELAGIVATLKSTALAAAVFAMVFLILTLANWSLFEGLIYTTLLKKKFTFRYLKKFLLLNIIWFIPWLALFFLIIVEGRVETIIISGLLLVALFIHFTLILNVLYTRTGKFQLRQTLKIGVTKIHHFLLPYVIIIITYIIIQQIIIPYVTMLLFLLFFSWVQNYTKDIILSIS